MEKQIETALADVGSEEIEQRENWVVGKKKSKMTAILNRWDPAEDSAGIT